MHENTKFKSPSGFCYTVHAFSVMRLFQRLRQQMEDYGEKPSDNLRNREMSFSKSTRFLAHQGHHQHQLSLLPLLESGGHHIPRSQSRFCKDFMETKFDEVFRLLFNFIGDFFPNYLSFNIDFCIL